MYTVPRTWRMVFGTFTCALIFAFAGFTWLITRPYQGDIMTTMFNPEMLENTIKHIETKEIPLVEQQYAEMESNYHRIAKNLLSTRDEEGNTTLDAQQTEELLDLLSQFNHISHELVLERKSRLRLCKEFLADSRKHITVKIPKFLKK